MATHLETDAPGGPEVQAPWKLVRRGGSTKVAFSLRELVGLTSDFSVKKAPNCTSKVIRTDAGKFLLVYRVTCGESYSDPNGHVVRLKFDFKRLKETGSADDLDVRVSCSCVAPDTWVRMADGTEKMIKDVRPGDMVLTHKGRARRVTHTTSRPAKPGEVAYRLKAEGYKDPLILSEDHPVAVVRGHEVCACGCGTPLCLSYQGRGTVRERWGRKWATGHGRFGVDRSPDHSGGRASWKTPPDLIDGEQLYFPKIQWAGQTSVDPDWASLVGYYLAEGCLQRVKAKRPELSKVAAQVMIDGELNYLYGVSFALNQNEEHTLVADIVAKVTKLFPEAGIILRKHKTQGGMSVEVRSATFAEQVYRLVGQGSLTKKLSDEVLAWDLDAMLELTASWALGDGYCGKRDQKACTSSRDLATQMSTVLMALGVWHGLSHEDPKVKNAARGYRLIWDYRRAPLLVGAMRSRMRDLDASRVTRHLVSTHERRESGIWGDGFIRRADNLVTVNPPSEFLDLTVEDDESFIANGVVVHNCPAWLWWGQQWNVSTGDALYGAPRPLLKAPTDPDRYKNIICKHVKVVADRIQPVLDRMLAKYQTGVDEAAEAEKQKQLDLVKQQTDLEAEAKRQQQVDKLKDRAKSETDAELEKLKQRQPITPKGTDDLDAMPDDLTTLGLPAKPSESPRPPITPKVKPQETPKPSNVTLIDDEGMGTTEIPAGRKHQPMNVKVVEDDDDTTTVLPGSKRLRMDEDLGVLPVSEAMEERGRKAPKDWADDAVDIPEAIAEPTVPSRPTLPPHLQQIEDDADDQVTKINRLKARMAALILAQGA